MNGKSKFKKGQLVFIVFEGEYGPRVSKTKWDEKLPQKDVFKTLEQADKECKKRFRK